MNCCVPAGTAWVSTCDAFVTPLREGYGTVRVVRRSEHTSQDVEKFIRQADASYRRRPYLCRWGKPGLLLRCQRGPGVCTGRERPRARPGLDPISCPAVPTE